MSIDNAIVLTFLVSKPMLFLENTRKCTSISFGTFSELSLYFVISERVLYVPEATLKD